LPKKDFYYFIFIRTFSHHTKCMRDIKFFRNFLIFYKKQKSIIVFIYNLLFHILTLFLQK